MNSNKQFFEQFKEVWAQTTQHIDQLQKVDKDLEHKSRNISHRLLQHHTQKQCPVLQTFCVQEQGVPSNSNNTTFRGDIGLP
jgi:hypothetical protein